jgi:hypothetical protein
LLLPEHRVIPRAPEWKPYRRFASQGINVPGHCFSPRERRSRKKTLENCPIFLESQLWIEEVQVSFKGLMKA